MTKTVRSGALRLLSYNPCSSSAASQIVVAKLVATRQADKGCYIVRVFWIASGAKVYAPSQVPHSPADLAARACATRTPNGHRHAYLLVSSGGLVSTGRAPAGGGPNAAGAQSHWQWRPY
jgi:hypothetical protein